MDNEELSPKFINEPLDRLLKLVDEGDPDAILAEENLVSTFNDLMKYGLVAMEDEKVYLTAEGKLAKEEGVENYIGKLEQKQEKLKNLPEEAELIPPTFFSNSKKLWSLGILLFILLAMFFSLLSFPE